jgi:aminoglycoside phosphotransferase (APT) family kinase protein
VATIAPFGSPAVAATALGEFLLALHLPAPPAAPENPFRGVPLADRDERLRRQLAQMADALDGPAVLTAWDELVATPVWSGAPVWLHGDLRPGNLLVDHGRLSAVIDFGDITAGDPATDLSIAWMLFDGSARRELRATVGADEDLWQRARGWALALGVAYVASSANDPVLSGEGHALIAAALSD